MNQPTDFDRFAFMSYKDAKLLFVARHMTCMAFLFLVSCERPTLPELIKMKLPSRVGPKLQTFSTLLLQDEFGDIVANIVEDCRGKTEKVIMEVLREWLAGKGVEVSWESLIATLRDCELSLMADQIQMALDQIRS